MNIYVIIQAQLHISITADFCGKPSWWFQPFWDGGKIGPYKSFPINGPVAKSFKEKGPDAKPTCQSTLQLLLYYDEKFCMVDLHKDFKDPVNEEYV